MNGLCHSHYVLIIEYFVSFDFFLYFKQNKYGWKSLKLKYCRFLKTDFQVFYFKQCNLL